MMMISKPVVASLFVFALFILPNLAGAADSWNLPGEEEVRFDATVTDVLCVLSGDCPPDCGAGKRVLGLLKADGELVLPIKNGGPFTGAVADLLPYCGTVVTADGLFTINWGVKLLPFNLSGRRRANGSAPTNSSRTGPPRMDWKPRIKKRAAGSAMTKLFWRSSVSRVNWV